MPRPPPTTTSSSWSDPLVRASAFTAALAVLLAVPVPAAVSQAPLLPTPHAVSQSAPHVALLAAAGAPTDVCTIDDPRAIELSGLVATTTGYVVINDSQFDPNDMRVFFLNRQCEVTRSVRYPTPARDPEDLAVANDGAVWVADTGDNVTNETRRSTIALWRLPPQGGPPVIHRLTYPDGAHDAEALLFGGDGNPVVITKELDGRAGLYAPAQPLRARTSAGVPLTRVGEFTPAAPAGSLFDTMITGAATPPDRRRVVLRTYTAAYEWDVPNGDVVTAVTNGTPRVTQLPDEPQGEAIAYTPDGKAFLTVSDERGPTTMRRYAPAAEAAPSGAGAPSLPGSASPGLPAGSAPSSTPVWYGVAGALVALLIAGAGLLGLRGRRRRRAGRGRQRLA